MEYKGVAPRWEGQGGVQGCGSEVGGAGWSTRVWLRGGRGRVEYKGVAPRWEGQGGVQGCGSEVGGAGWRIIHGCSHHSTYVPLLYKEKRVVHSCPDVARRFAITARMFSNTDCGTTYFHKAALLLPMVVSMVTFLITSQ